MNEEHKILAESHALEVINASAVLAEAIEKSRKAQIDEALSNETVTDQIFKKIDESIATAIKLNVNGKIDKMRADNEQWHEERKKDMVEVRQNMEETKPIILAYKKAQQDVATATRGGRVVLWLAATITALGGAYLVLRAIFFKF